MIPLPMWVTILLHPLTVYLCQSSHRAFHRATAASEDVQFSSVVMV